MLTDPHREHDDDDPLDGSALQWAPGVSFTAADDDYLTVMLLACGLARIRDDRRRLDTGEFVRRTSAEHGLLPVPWRSGAVRLWWRFVRAGAAPAVSDLELIELCRKPFAAWPVRLRLSVADQDMTLLDRDDLSPFAEQAARLTVRDVEAELVENQIFAALMMAAEMNGKTEDEVQANYVRLRRLLIDKPVLADQDVHRLAGTFRACSSRWPPSAVRLSSNTTSRLSRSTPSRSIRRRASVKPPNSSDTTSTPSTIMSIRARSSRWRSALSRTCSTEKVVDGTGISASEVISNKGTRSLSTRCRPR